MLRLMLDKGVDYIAAILLAVMTILVFMQVLFRYWLHLPLDWGRRFPGTYSSGALCWVPP